MFMRLLLHPALILCICFLTLSTPLSAAEVTNLRTHFSGSHMSIEYDLLGTSGEKTSGVEVLLDINGNRYASNMLSMSGDFGSSIALGKNRRITWTHPQDFPEGVDATFKCIVNAVPDSIVINEGTSPSEGIRATYYAVNKQTVVETRTKLMWTRNADIPIKPMKHSDAEKQIEKLNQERYAGYNDWRMPTREDFEGLVSFGTKAGWGTALAHFIADYLTTCGFTRVQPGNYWTSTTEGAAPDRFFAINTWNGIVRPLAGDYYYYLWPVRTAR
jgi:hypothetical protein